MLQLTDFIPPAELPAIVARTSTFDCSLALAAAIAALPAAGGALWVGPGKFNFSTPIELTKTIRLMGEGNGNAPLAPTVLQVPVNTNGIVFDAAAPGSIVEGLSVQGIQTGATSGDGVTFKSRGTLRNVDVHYFGRYGIRVDPQLNLGENCNNFQIDKVNVSNCNSDGYFTNGQDSNAGCIIALSIKNCLGAGINESSFLGNTHIAGHTAGNALGAYKTDGLNANNVFVGCYAENGQGSGNSYVTQTLVLGGTNMGSASGVLQVLGNREILNYRSFPPVSVSPSAAGEMAFEKTSDKILTIRVKGADGKVRAATLTLK